MLFCRLPVLLSDRLYIVYRWDSFHQAVAAIAVVVWCGVVAAVAGIAGGCAVVGAVDHGFDLRG